jgi:hypothetical protein
MKNELMIINNEKEITAIIQDSTNMYLEVLNALGLPTDNILSSINERKAAILNLPHIIKKVDNSLISDSYYLSKFFVALANGLFDAALNYLWDETINQLRIRVINGDINYFYDIVLSDSKRSSFKKPEHLFKLDDIELIKGAFDIGLITQIGFMHLDFIRNMRNWASAAHPNQAELTGLNLISWLEMCIKEVISTPPSTIQIRIGRLLSNIKTEELTDNDTETIKSFFTELSVEKANALVKGFFGIYIDQNTTQQTKANINRLAPSLWEIISEEVKYSFGIRYATFQANGDKKSKEYANDFLEIVEGLSYLPDNVKIPIIKNSLENLIVAHNSFNNFYTEPSFASQLKSVIGTHGSIPSQLDYQYVKTIVTVFLTNGYGIANLAEPIYIDLIKSFTSRQTFIALISFTDDLIRSKLQFKLCQEKFEEMLNYLEPNITSEGIQDLLEEIREKRTNLYIISKEDSLFKKIHYFEKHSLR